MSRKFNSALFVILTTGLFGVSAAMAAPSYLDGSSKARGDYGQGIGSFAAPMYRTTSPSVARSYSYEPSQNLAASKPVSPKADASAKVETKKSTAGAIANNNTRSTRSYSYDPSSDSASASIRSSSSTPLFLLPKGDNRKFGGR